MGEIGKPKWLKRGKCGLVLWAVLIIVMFMLNVYLVRLSWVKVVTCRLDEVVSVSHSLPERDYRVAYVTSWERGGTVKGLVYRLDLVADEYQVTYVYNGYDDDVLESLAGLCDNVMVHYDGACFTRLDSQ